MQYLVAVLVIIIVLQAMKSKKSTTKTPIAPEEELPRSQPLDLTKAYKSKWLFSYNEKDAFAKIKEITSPLGYEVFAKVRLLDLLEPISGNPKYKTYFYKVQAKHVDFVLCDQKLVAKYIIELDDSSHNQTARKERDTFVDTVLQSVGYKVLHTRGITKDEIETFLGVKETA